MEYSLRILNKTSELKSLTLKELVNTLNLIGFEVDNIEIRKLDEAKYLENINLLLKIPSNRDDLLNQEILKIELSTIFIIYIYSLWQNLKENYLFILKQKYFQYQNYKNYKIETELLDFLIYSVEVSNVKNTKIPFWIKKKLLDAAIIPKNNFSDLLTLVNLEWGQSFILSPLMETNIENNNLRFEKLSKSITIQDLNKNQYILPKETIVLKTNDDVILNVIGLNNIQFGDLNTSQDKVFLSGIFYNMNENPLNLNSFSNKIFLKNLRKSYLEYFRISIQRILTLLELITFCEINIKKYSSYSETLILKSHKILSVNKENLRKIINNRTILLTIFEKAGLKIICTTPKELYIQIPSYRVDLSREIDLIEEYTRFVGYKNFEEIIPQKEIFYSKKRQKQISLIKNFFINQQFVEIVSNSLNNKNHFSNNVHLLNPLNNEISGLRTDLISNLVDIFATNNSQQDLFEIGRVFKKSHNNFIEQEKLGAIIISKNNEVNLEWFRIKGFLENFLSKFGYFDLSFEKTYSFSKYLHPTRSFKIKYGDKTLGIFGQIHPKLSKNLCLKKSLFLVELNLSYFKKWRVNSKVISYVEISKYPLVTKDLSFLVNKNINFATIKKEIEKNSIFLKSINFFDIYIDKKVNEAVNIGLRLAFQSSIQTLTNEMIEFEIVKIKNFLVANFEADIRL